MTEASEAEFRPVEDLVARVAWKVLAGSGVLVFTGILASGWPVLAQGVAICGLAAVVAGLGALWRHHAPPPEPPPEAPPFARVTPRPRVRGRARPPAP